MQLQPKQKMIINMTRYGSILGGLAGAASALTLIFTSNSFSFLSNTVPAMMLETLSIAIFGMVFGGIFGVLAGLYSGVGMAVITSLFYEDIPSIHVYKSVMGGVTAVCVAFFLYTTLWNLRIDGIESASWNATMMMTVILAVYASQRVTSYYLYEWVIHRQKAYVA